LGSAPGGNHPTRRWFLSHLKGDVLMTISLVNLQPLVALIAGILILIMPRLLNYIVAIYLIVIGVAGLADGNLLR
jgi:hypothetical protein